MLTKPTKKILPVFLCYFTCLLAGAQNKFIVRIKDSSGIALRGASVQVANGSLFFCDSKGTAAFSAQPGAVITVSHTGYISESGRLGASDTTVILRRDEKTFADVTVYAFSRRGTLVNTAAAVSVIGKNTLERFQPGSFVPAISTVPGVKMDERSPGSYRISIRGNLLRSTFGVRNVKVYLNNLPYTDASGNTYFNELALNSIDNMEIIRGPAGSMYGAGTGGVILLNNTPAQKASALEITGGSYGLFSAAGKYFFGKEGLNQSLSFTHTQSDGYRSQSVVRRDVGGYTVSAKAGSRQVITGNILYSNLFYETPGGLTAAQLAADPRQARPATTTFPSAAAQRAAIYLSSVYASVSDEIHLRKNFVNTTGAYFNYTDFKNPAIRNFEKDNEKGTGGRTVFEFTPKQYSFQVGAEYQYSFINTATFGNRSGIKDTLQYHDKIPVHQLNVFAQASAVLPFRSELTAGISYNDFYYGFHRVSIPTQQDRANFSPQYIPRVSLLKKITALGSAYLSYSRGYSPPSIDEIHATDGSFNTSLGAEQGDNYETGLKMRMFRNRLSADLTGYIFHLHNTIVSRQDASGATFYTNAGRTNQQGLEFELHALAYEKARSFLNRLQFGAAGTFVHARFADYAKGTKNYNGNRLTGTPPFVLSVSADAKTSCGLYTNLTYTYTDRTPLNDANTYFAKAYNLLFARLGWQKMIHRKTMLDIFATMQKSFNKGYSLGNDLNADGNRFFNPSAVQVFTAGVGVHL